MPARRTPVRTGQGRRLYGPPVVPWVSLEVPGGPQNSEVYLVRPGLARFQAADRRTIRDFKSPLGHNSLPAFERVKSSLNSAVSGSWPTRDRLDDIRSASSRTVRPGGSNNDHDYLPNLFTSQSQDSVRLVPRPRTDSVDCITPPGTSPPTTWAPPPTECAAEDRNMMQREQSGLLSKRRWAPSSTSSR